LFSKTIEKRSKKRSFNDRFQKRLTTLPILHINNLIRVSKFSFSFFRENFVQPTKMWTKTKMFVHFRENFRSKLLQNSFKIFAKLVKIFDIFEFIEQKLNKNIANMRSKFFSKMHRNSQKFLTNFVRSFLRISLNVNFDWNPI